MGPGIVPLTFSTYLNIVAYQVDLFMARVFPNGMESSDGLRNMTSSNSRDLYPIKYLWNVLDKQHTTYKN